MRKLTTNFSAAVRMLPSVDCKWGRKEEMTWEAIKLMLEYNRLVARQNIVKLITVAMAKRDMDMTLNCINIAGQDLS